MSLKPTNALLKRFKDGNKERFPDIGNVISEIGGEWAFKTIILSMEDYADEQTASLQKQVELLKVRAEKLAEREQRTGAENAGLLARIEHLQAENAAANKRIEELFKEKQELERKYNLLRYGSE